MEMPKYKYTEVIEYWKNKNIGSMDELKNELNHFSVLFAYNSGVIENKDITYHDTREIFINGKVVNYTGDLKTLYEIRNQKVCYEYLLDKIVSKEPISEELLKTIHKKLTKGTYDERRYITNGERPGEYKKHDYVTGKNEVGSTIKNVEEDIKILIEEVNGISKNDTESLLKIASYLHNVIEQIHPFADGNGRVGRTVMNYYLMIHDLPPVIIYEEDKNYYYDALEEFDENDNLNPTIEFMKYEMEKTWEKSMDRIHGITINHKLMKEYF